MRAFANVENQGRTKNMTKKLSIADFFSLVNAILGFFAIISLISSFVPDEFKIRISLTFLLLALLADGIDGIIGHVCVTV